jgi:hypothetical protein
VIHGRDDDWGQLTRWFYPALSSVDPDSSDPFARGLLRFLDAPHQAIIETPASLVVSFDFGMFNSAVQAGAGAADHLVRDRQCHRSARLSAGPGCGR